MKLKEAAFAAIIAAAGLPATVAAEPGLSGESIAVAVGESHAQTHTAIRRAAWQMCLDQFDPRFHERRSLGQCVAATVDDAVARSGDTALKRYHAALARSTRYAAPA